MTRVSIAVPAAAMLSSSLAFLSAAWALPPAKMPDSGLQVSAGIDVLRQAVRRSYEACKKREVTAETCDASLKDSYRRLRDINAQIKPVLEHSPADFAKIERRAADCINDRSTLEDMVACFQVAVAAAGIDGESR